MKKFNLFITLLLLSYGAIAQQSSSNVSEADNAGYISLFNGENLDGWDYDPVYWSVKDGIMVGVVTPETILKRNSFIIWQGGQPTDFDLKMEYRVSAKGNSGINYRSLDIDSVTHALTGYQLDIDGKGEWTGQNYEEKARKFLALRGSIVQVGNDGKPIEIGSTGDKDQLFEECINKEDWNSCHIIARGNTMIHIINGRVMSVVVDDDEQGRTMRGKIGMQVHTGPPMKIEYRNIMLKNY